MRPSQISNTALITSDGFLGNIGESLMNNDNVHEWDIEEASEQYQTLNGSTSARTTQFSGTSAAELKHNVVPGASSSSVLC